MKDQILQQLDDADRSIAAGHIQRAENSIRLAEMLTNQLDKSRSRKTKLGVSGGTAALSFVADLADGSFNHPVGDLAVAPIAGYLLGKFIADKQSEQDFGPIRARIQRAFGDVWRLRGDFEKARKHYARALEFLPSDQLIRDRLAEVL